MKKYLSILLSTIVILSACNKEENDTDINTNYGVEKDLTLAVSDLSSVLHFVDGVMDYVDSNNTSLTFSNCIDKELVGFYPDSSDGIHTNFVKAKFYNKRTCDLTEVKDGALLIYYSGSRAEGNFKDSIVFDNFSINDRTITGYISQEQTAQNKNYSNTISSKHTLNTTNRSFVGEINTSKSDYGTENEKWLISGTGLFASNEVAIENDLRIDFSCLENHPWRFAISGAINNKSETISRTINYGDNRCDRGVSIQGTNDQSITHTLF